MKKLILIDSHAIIHRAYHALPVLTSPAGEPVQAVYGFTSILLKILRELKPDYIAAAFDLPGPTFRHAAYARYKAHRPEAPSELVSQFARVREALEAFGIPIFQKESYEADDIIGTIAKMLEKNKEVEIIVVTGDLDTLQLIRPRLRVYAMKKGISETVIYGDKEVKERYGCKPCELIDYKGLRGDPSDNIPGVKGIGEKTASELIKKFGSLERIYQALRKNGKNPSELQRAGISPALAEKLRQGEEDAKFSRELARIKTDVPFDFKLEEVRRLDGENKEAIRKVFLALGFYSLLKRLDTVEDLVKTRPRTLPGLEPRSKNVISGLGDFKKFLKRTGRIGILIHGGGIFLIREGDKPASEINTKLLSEKAAKNFFEKRKDFYCHDVKAVIRFLRPHGIELGGAAFDTMLAAYLVGSFTRDFSYEAVLAREFGRIADGDLQGEFAHLFEIADLLKKKLADGKLRDILERIELPLARILADMEERGILIDRGFLSPLAKEVGASLEKIAGEIHSLVGEDFNINSPQQLSKILFDKLKIKTYGLRKTEKSGVVSTGAAELEKLRSAHPIIAKILEYRELTKLKNTYIDVLPELVNPETGRLHTTFNQTGTVTGRLSSSDPNLQNIPIMSEIGREIRKAFVAEKSFLLASFDYSQIELRVAAHLANDQKMIEAFRKGLDIHALTASEVYNTPLEKVTPDLRRAAKTLNFGILYGMGPRALAEATSMSREEARKFIDEYFRDFTGIRDYIERTKKLAEENGYVETLFGRRRYIPEIQSSNWQLKREAERMAVNMPIQGTATGDIVKMAMIKIDEWIRKEKLQDEVRMLLQVHDELLFEIKEDMAKKAAPRIKELMEGVADLKVPLVVDAKVGDNWGEQKKIL